MHTNPDEQIMKLNLELPPAPPPGGVYHPVVVVGRTLYISGQAPLNTDGTPITGKVGRDLSVEEGYTAARQTALTMLSTLKSQIGSLQKIKRLIKTLGMVNCLPDFEQHPAVINGYSELMRDLWGEEYGIGARSAVGMTLPGNIAVEIEAIFELHN